MRLKKLLLTGTMAVTLTTVTIAGNTYGINQVKVAADTDDEASNNSSDSSSNENSDKKTPLEKPDGSTDGGVNDMGTPPDKPDDSSGGSLDNMGTPPDGAPGGNSNGEAPSDMPGGGGGANTQTFDYSGEYSGTLTVDGSSEEASKTSDGETLEATDMDVNSVLVENGGTLEITNATLNKSGDDTSGDNCNFYGLNAILLTLNENSKTYISNSTLTADSEGSNAIFATDGGTVFAYNNTINTTANSARGLDATYGGIIVADSMDITTQGDHCATIATDRGGGTISVTSSTLETYGSGSPLIYSTGDIEVSGVSGTANSSQIAGMEGLNTIIILNSDLESTITGKTASDPIADAIILYQSMSGDADTSTGDAALFQAVDSSLTSAIEEGAFFYITNTNVNVLLSNTEINYDDSKANLITIAGNDANSWGSAGSNGATSNFTLLDEEVKGNIEVDTISSLNFYVLEGSTYTGATSITENTDATETVDNNLTINVDESSTWIVTGDSTVNNLNVANGGQIVDEDGKSVNIVVSGETVEEGDSDITITVTGSYGTEVTTSDVNVVYTNYYDRSEFDEYFGTSTVFANATVSESGDADSSEAVEDSEDGSESTEANESTESESTETSEKQEKDSGLWIIVVAVAVGLCATVMCIFKKKK